MVKKHLLWVAIFVAFAACVRWQVRKELAVLYGFENIAQLRQTLRADVCHETAFVQGGTNYTGVTILPSKHSLVLSHTQFFHQASPVYIFGGNGLKVDFTRNHNDDHAFFHRWTEMFPAAKSCRCGWRRSF